MANIRPEEIRTHEFKRTVRGYDRDEVRYFLSMLADEFARLLQQIEELKTELEELKSRVPESSGLTPDEVLEKAREQAELIITGAESKASLIIQKAEKKVNELQMRIAQLKTEKATLTIKIRRMLQSQLDLIEMLEEDDYSLDDEEQDS